MGVEFAVGVPPLAAAFAMTDNVRVRSLGATRLD